MSIGYMIDGAMRNLFGGFTASSASFRRMMKKTFELWIEEYPSNFETVLKELGYIKKPEPEEVKKWCSTCMFDALTSAEEPCKSCRSEPGYDNWRAKT